MKLKFVDKGEFYSAFNNISETEREATAEFVEADYDFGDFEVAYSYFAGCMILRYYSADAGYHFDAPFPITESASVEDAFAAISEYCRQEAICETVVGVEPDLLDSMLRGADNYSLAEDEDGTFAVRIITECMQTECLPEAMYEDVYLGEFLPSYADEYERLLKDVNLNRHFGYNILDDMPNGTGVDFIENAKNEFERSESMTFAATVRENGKSVFVGEGVLYGFDGRGSAFLAFRVLPEFHRRGIGGRIFMALRHVAVSIGLKHLIAEVKPENEASVALLSKHGKGKKLADRIAFTFDV